MKKKTLLGILIFVSIISGIIFMPTEINAAEGSSSAELERYEAGKKLYQEGKYLEASRVFFSVYTDESVLSSHKQVALESLGYLTESLINGGLPNTATYFYIKSVLSSKVSSRKVLPHLPKMLNAVGVDILKNYVVSHTEDGDYEVSNKGNFYYFLGKDRLLKDKAQEALNALQKVSINRSLIGAGAAQLRATAHGILGHAEQSLEYFKTCARLAGGMGTPMAEDLEYRCVAGQARVYYQMGKYEQAEEVYDEIPKKSFVWTDILFEQAWNAYAQEDYNRALGKLVTYRSPHLKFIYNPEIDVLRAQSFLALCLYDDVNRSVNEFNGTYEKIGKTLKNFLMTQATDYPTLYAQGKKALREKLHTDNYLNKALNRVVRGPYFATLVSQEKATLKEYAKIKSKFQSDNLYSQFLDKVIVWRLKTIRLLGGIYIRNSMVDHYNEILENFDKMSYIKTEMLSRMKSRLVHKGRLSEDEDGVMKKGRASIGRKDHQYYWSFNGEFWNDELGDYVFALDSECQ